MERYVRELFVGLSPALTPNWRPATWSSELNKGMELVSKCCASALGAAERGFMLSQRSREDGECRSKVGNNTIWQTRHAAWTT